MENCARGTEEFLAFLENEKRLVRTYRSHIRHMASGKLMISNGAAGPVFYRTEITKEGKYTRKRITGNMRVVYLLAHKRFTEEYLRRKEHNIALYEEFAAKLLHDSVHDVISSLPKGFAVLDYSKILDPSVRNITWPNPSRDPEIKPEPVRLFVDDMSPEEWASAPYCENTIGLENKKHRTSRGLYCRSKGEVSLIDVADELGYRFRYDCVIIIEGLEISPDLIIIRPDGRLIFVEHHGWIDEGSGDSAFLRKLWLYSKAGIVQGRNLLVTFDRPDGSADIELIRRQLRNMVE